MNRFNPIALLMLLALPGAGQQDDDARAAERRAAENREVLLQLPEGDGKVILQARCVECHGLARVSAGHKSQKSWSNTLQVMIINGAKLKDDEIAALAEFLAVNFGLAVNINAASAAELARVPMLDDRLSAAIIAYREKNGLFTKIEDLAQVEGFSADLVNRIRNKITIGVVPKKP